MNRLLKIAASQNSVIVMGSKTISSRSKEALGLRHKNPLVKGDIEYDYRDVGGKIVYGAVGYKEAFKPCVMENAMRLAHDNWKASMSA